MSKLLCLIILFSWSSLSFTKVAQVEGDVSKIGFIKKRAELKLFESNQICRGSQFLKSTSWKCKLTSPDYHVCVGGLECTQTTKTKKRALQLRRLKRELSRYPYFKSNFKIHVNQTTMDLAYNSIRGVVVKSVKKPIYKVQRLKTVSKVNKTKRKKVKREPKPKVVKKIVKKVKVVDEWGIEDEEELTLSSSQINNKVSDDEDEFADDAWLEETKKETPSSIQTDKKYSLLNFGLGYMTITNSYSGSVSTLELNWTPHFWLNNEYALVGNVGFHSFSTIESFEGAGDDETFFVNDMSVGALYKFNSSIYVNSFIGIQKWGNLAGDSHSTFSLGGGYYFKNFKSFKIERVYFQYASISNELKNTELKFGVGFSF